MTDKTSLISRLTAALAAKQQRPLRVTVNEGFAIEILWQTPLADGVQIVYRSPLASGSESKLFAGVYHPDRQQMTPCSGEETERVLSLLEQLLPPAPPVRTGAPSPAESEAVSVQPEPASRPEPAPVPPEAPPAKARAHTAESAPVQKLLVKAQTAEKAGQWLEAAEAYEAALVTGRIAGQLVWNLEYACGQLFRRAAEPERAFFHIFRAAQGDHMEAALACGSMCEHGEGTEASLDQARSWYQRIAAQPCVKKAEASYLLANTYEDTDPAAFAWYKEAAKLGHAEAQRKLGILFHNGSAPGGQDFAEALRWFQLAAEQNDAEAQCLLGIMYRKGTAPGGKNPDEAFRYFKLAAEQGDAGAQNLLGAAFYHGTAPGGQDYREALRWYERAAAQGKADAQAAAAKQHYKGTGTPVNYGKALQWALKAAAQNHARSAFLCARMFFRGEGTKKDNDAGVRYLRQAAELDDPMACFYYGLGLQKGQYGLKADPQEGLRFLTKSAMNHYADAQYVLGADAYQQALAEGGSFDSAQTWLRMAAENGQADASYYCGELYRHGRGVVRDPRKAKQYYQQAIERGSKFSGSACFCLGMLYCNEIPRDYAQSLRYFLQGETLGDAACTRAAGYTYFQGYGVKKDYAKALQLFEKAAARKEVLATHYLAEMHYFGYGVPEDRAKAFYYYEQAAKLGHNVSAGQCAVMCYNGDGVKKDKALALQYAEPAAQNTEKGPGDPIAQYICGLIYYNGFHGLPKDREKAIEYFRRSAGQNNRDAQYFYGSFLYSGKDIPADPEKGAEYLHKAAAQGQPMAKRMIKLLHI